MLFIEEFFIIIPLKLGLNNKGNNKLLKKNSPRNAFFLILLIFGNLIKISLSIIEAIHFIKYGIEGILSIRSNKNLSINFFIFSKLYLNNIKTLSIIPLNSLIFRILFNKHSLVKILLFFSFSIISI